MDDPRVSLIDRLGYGTVVTTGIGSAVPPAATFDPENRGAGALPSAVPPNMAGSDPGAAAPSEPRRASAAVLSEARPPSGASPTSMPVPTAESPAASQSARKWLGLRMDAVLGTVFSKIGVVGASGVPCLEVTQEKTATTAAKLGTQVRQFRSLSQILDASCLGYTLCLQRPHIHFFLHCIKLGNLLLIL